MNCIILGDKYQKGMKSRGCSGLIKITKNTSIIENQYLTLKNIFDNINITYVYGFDSKKFLDYLGLLNLDIELVYNNDFNKFGHIFSLNLASYAFDDDLIIIDGYKSITKGIFKKFNPDVSQIFLYEEKNNSDPGCIINSNNNIENFSFDLDNSIANIYYLNKECARVFKQLITSPKNYNNFVFEILNKMIDKGLILKPLILNKMVSSQ